MTLPRLNTEDAPRIILDVARAEQWLAGLVSPEDPQHYSAPSEYGVHLFAEWAPDLALTSDPGLREQVVETLVSLPAAAFELGIVHGGSPSLRVQVEFTHDDMLRFLISDDESWASLSLATTLVGVANLVPVDCFGDKAAIAFLAHMVDEVNIAMHDLVIAAESVLAQLSNDPVLLTRLADSDEPVVRDLALDNPFTPDEGQTLGALRRLTDGR